MVHFVYMTSNNNNLNISHFQYIQMGRSCSSRKQNLETSSKFTIIPDSQVNPPSVNTFQMSHPMYHVHPPEQFDVKNPLSWPLLIKRF